MNQVNLYQQPSPSLGYTPRQTNAEANYHQARAHAMADPRFNAKQFDRPGSSRGKGQYAYGAAQAATAYADSLSQGEAARMQDAYSNAGLRLNDQARQQDFGLALSGLQEQDAQQAAMFNLGQQGRALDFAGNAFNQMMGSAGQAAASPMAAYSNFGGGVLKGLM